MTGLEPRLWKDNRGRGVMYTAVGVAVGATTGRFVRSTALAVAIACAGRELRSVAATIEDACQAEHLDEARRRLPALVGRDPSQLDESGIAAAVIESLAENMVDAVVAPVFWGALLGAPGALGYRAINTMDAMVGHKSDRYRNFGWAAARLDDAANYVPARLFALGVMATANATAAEIRHAVATTASAHPSPNAGVAEAAVAGALGCELGGPLKYDGVVDNRPRLGSGPRPQPSDIASARALATRVENLLIAALLGLATPNMVRSLVRKFS